LSKGSLNSRVLCCIDINPYYLGLEVIEKHAWIQAVSRSVAVNEVVWSTRPSKYCKLCGNGGIHE
jgi:hypothetical protein